MSFVPATADADLWVVLGILVVTAGTLHGLDWRARRRASAHDGNGAAADHDAPDDGPPPARMDGEI
jgi:hypothetical protein